MSGGEAIAVGVFLFSGAVLFYIYCGYGWLLTGLKRAGLAVPFAEDAVDLPSVTVLVTAHNEEREIAARLADLRAQDYPRDKLEILVATDGTTDRTHAIVEGVMADDATVRLLSSQERVGKSAAQNHAIPQARGEIVVLTDAATRFGPGFVTEIVKPFADPQVGCTTGTLELIARPGAVARGQGYYWRYEMKLRALESDLGFLAVTSGQAMAFRRALFQPMPPHIGDDCIIPLDIALAGFRVVHRPQAIAYDTFEHDLGQETRSRIRMTMRNLLGTWLRPRLLDPLRRPGYALALWSHKILRWLGWVFLLAFLASAAALAFSPHLRVASLAVAGLCLLAPIGWYSHRHGRNWRLAEMVFSFFLANAAFLIGTVRAMTGERIVAYRSGGLGVEARVDSLPAAGLTARLRRVPRLLAVGLLWFGLCIGSLSIFAAHPVFALGVWSDAEPMGLVFYTAAACCFAGLALLCLDGTAVLRGLCHPAVLASAALGAWSLATAPLAAFPMLSVFGPAQNSLGALWYLAFAAFTASAITLRCNRALFGSLVAIASGTALAAAGFNLWRVNWPDSVRDLLPWLSRTTLLEFNEYQAYYALALLALALVMLRERRLLAARLLAVIGIVSLLVSRNRSALVAVALAFLPAALPARRLSWLAPLRPWREAIAVAGILVIGAGSYLALRLIDFHAIAPTLRSRRLIFEGIEPSMLDSATAALVGHGWGRYADYLVADVSLAGIRIYNPDWASLGRDLFHSHHAFVEALFAAGLPGLALAAAIPIALVLGTQRRWGDIAIAFVLSWVVVDCFWFMMPATLPVLALAYGAMAESARSWCRRWSRGPWAVALSALLLVTVVGIAGLYGEARSMSRLIECLSPGRAGPCDAGEIATDPRGAEYGLASIVGDTVPTLLRSAPPRPDWQLDLVRRVLAEAERRDKSGRSILLTLELADCYAAIAFVDGGDRVMAPDALFAPWTRVMHDVLRRAPHRLDVMVTYFSWLLVHGRDSDIEAMLAAARRVDPNHPVVLWFSGIETLKPGDAATREQGLNLMRRAIDRGLERFMPVDPSLKARLAGPAK